MIHRLFTFAFFLSISFFANAQSSSKADSLLQLLKSLQLTEESRLKVIIQLIDIYYPEDRKQALVYVDTAIYECRHNKELEKKLPWLLMRQGDIYLKELQYRKAAKSLNEGLELAVRFSDKLSEAKIYIALALLAENSNEIVKSLELYQKALNIYSNEKDTTGMALAYNNIGIIYWDKHEFKKAMEYYKKGLSITSPRSSVISKARLINNIGLIFQDMDQYDSALFYFKKSMALLDRKKHAYGYALISNNLGIWYREMNRYDEALEQFETSKKIETELSDKYGLGLVNENISRVHFARGKYRESLSSLDEAFKFAKEINNFHLLESISQNKARTYEKLGDFRLAYTEEKQAKIYNDSIQSKSLSKELAAMEVKYQVKQQQAENDLLKTENELITASNRSKDLLIVVTSVFSLLTLILLFIVYRALRAKQKANLIIAEQKDEIASQNEELSTKNRYLEELNHEKNSLMAIVAHDLKSPFNSIGGIANILPTIGPLNEEQKKFITLIDDVVDNSRNLIQDLMDLSALENREMKVHRGNVFINEILSQCQSEYQTQAQQKGIQIEILDTMDDSAPIISDKQHIARILQNLTSNAIKFSQSGTKVFMGYRKFSDHVEFYVKDEGPGISAEDQKNLYKKFHKLSARPTNGESSSGLGLSIVKALVEELNGRIQVESIVGKGSTFTCILPLQ
jgi:signal transduction histidine kinase/Tfp pilus assembly protein PilF